MVDPMAVVRRLDRTLAADIAVGALHNSCFQSDDLQEERGWLTRVALCLKI